MTMILTTQCHPCQGELSSSEPVSEFLIKVMARPQRPAPGSVVLQCLYWSATGPITMHNKPAQLMASHGSADSPGFGGGWGLPHAASWLSRPPQVGGLTGVASCSGERGEQGGESTPPPRPPHVHRPCFCCSASVSLAKSSLKAKPEVRGQGSMFYLCGNSCRSLDRGWGHREG